MVTKWNADLYSVKTGKRRSSGFLISDEMASEVDATWWQQWSIEELKTNGLVKLGGSTAGLKPVLTERQQIIRTNKLVPLEEEAVDFHCKLFYIMNVLY